MLVPLSWLKEYVDLVMPTNALAERITLAGMEVEGIERVGEWWDTDKIIIGQILSVKKHPNADRLTLVDVKFGNKEPEQVVTGAPNLFQYKDTPPEELPVLKAPFARVGAVLLDAYSEETPRPKKELKPSKIRGVWSNGMVCSERELGLSEEHEGILLLPEDAPVGVSLREYLGDEVLELGLTPDMARCLSMIGVAREVAALSDAPLHLPADEWQTGGDGTAADYVEIEIAAPELCNRYTGVIIKNVQIGDSPRWMQERLRKAGMRPISNVVDITNYVMLEWGQPLHAFDYDVLAARAAKSGAVKPRVIVRTAQAGEKMTTLDGAERALDESMLLITDTAGPIALAGVMGGEETEVSASTRTILLESATFEGINNRRTAQKLKLPSEASQRFTRGVPASLNPIATRRAAELMRLYAGGQIVPGMVDAYPVHQPQPVIYTTASEVRRQLGTEISLEQIGAALQKLDCVVEPAADVATDAPAKATFALHREAGEPLLRVLPPWHRLDLQIPADLTEEVARVIGYERIEATLLADVLPPQRHNLALETEEKIRDVLVGCGLQETINYALTTPEQHEKLTLGQEGAGEQQTPYITLENPLSVRRRAMRRSLMVSALENLEFNSRYTTRLATFEVGRVYLPERGDGVLPLEDRRVSILLSGPRREVGFHADPVGAEPVDFFDIKGVVEALLERMGVAPEEVEFAPWPNKLPFGPNCAELKIRGKVEGILGVVDARVRQAFDVPAAPICLVEIRVEPLIKPSWSLEVMKPISAYPLVVEDLAFVVAEAVPAQQVVEAIRAAGNGLLTDVELFDLYRGQPIPAGQKSLAYKLTYQSLEKSLTDDEVAAVRNRIIGQVAESVGGTLRA
ncbi:MAG TPA: phenylalanine--tRNA ligase subunit beta [Ktedonobacterales bacterium]|nr:phenylalanine--tRNA ligase subunit beta [Ktedonobacterales bacterium]